MKALHKPHDALLVLGIPAIDVPNDGLLGLCALDVATDSFDNLYLTTVLP